MTILARAWSSVAWLLGAVVCGAADRTRVRLYNEAHGARDRAARRAGDHAADADAAPTRRRSADARGRLRDLARLFPASGVGDKALWQGGMLSGRRLRQWGDPVDRAAALRAFETLRTSLPGQHADAPGRRRSQETRPTRRLPSRRRSARRRRSLNQRRPRRRQAARGAGRACVLHRPQPTPTAPPPAAPVAPPTAPTATALLTAIRHEAVPGRLRVTLEVDRETAFRGERLDGPSRVFVDLQQTRAPRLLRDAVIPVTGGGRAAHSRRPPSGRADARRPGPDRTPAATASTRSTTRTGS